MAKKKCPQSISPLNYAKCLQQVCNLNCPLARLVLEVDHGDHRCPPLGVRRWGKDNNRLGVTSNCRGVPSQLLPSPVLHTSASGPTLMSVESAGKQRLIGVCPDANCDPEDCSPPGSSLSMGKRTGVGCHFLLQGIFSKQALNLLLLHWQADSLPLRHQSVKDLLLGDYVVRNLQNGTRIHQESKVPRWEISIWNTV